LKTLALSKLYKILTSFTLYAVRRPVTNTDKWNLNKWNPNKSNLNRWDNIRPIKISSTSYTSHAINRDKSPPEKSLSRPSSSTGIDLSNPQEVRWRASYYRQCTSITMTGNRISRPEVSISELSILSSPKFAAKPTLTMDLNPTLQSLHQLYIRATLWCLRVYPLRLPWSNKLRDKQEMGFGICGHEGPHKWADWFPNPRGANSFAKALPDPTTRGLQSGMSYTPASQRTCSPCCCL